MGFVRNVITAAAMVASVAGVSQAQVAVTGNTKGCFGSYSCTATTNSSNGLAGVSFAGTSFNWNALTTPQTFTLGQINFQRYSCAGLVGLCWFDPASGIFTLETTFTAPPTTPGAGTFDAFINAGFSAGTGGASVNFDNAQQSFAFNGGTLFLSVNDLNVDAARRASGTYDITGSVYYTSTPEPSSIALLGTGLFGLVPMVRRRRK